MAPDTAKYPSVNLAYAAGRAGGTMTGVLSAANEKAVEMFIDEKYVSLVLIENIALLSFKTWWVCFLVFLEFCVILSFNKERAKDHLNNACIQGGNPIGLPLAMEARGQGSNPPHLPWRWFDLFWDDVEWGAWELKKEGGEKMEKYKNPKKKRARWSWIMQHNSRNS